MSSSRSTIFLDEETLEARRLRLTGPKTAIYMAQGVGRADRFITSAPKSLLQKYSFLARQTLSGGADSGKIVLAQGSATDEGIMMVLGWMRQNCETEESNFLVCEGVTTAKVRRSDLDRLSASH